MFKNYFVYRRNFFFKKNYVHKNLCVGNFELQTYSLFFNKLKIQKLRNEVSESCYTKLEPSLL